MIGALAVFLDVVPEALATFSMVFLRIASAMFILPVFGETMVPLRVRLGVGLAFSFIVFPSIAPPASILDTSTRELALWGLAEVLSGLAIGLLLRFHIMAIQVAASIAAQSTSLSQLLGNNSIDPQPALGLVLYLAALALAVELGLHVQFAMFFIASYDVVHMGSLIGSDLANTIRDGAAVAFRFGFVLATPFVAASLLYNLALGVINRAMPQLMVAFVGAPAITLGALVLLALTTPLILSIWLAVFQWQINNPFGVP